MGVLCGLTLSAVKRSLGAKDWGVMIEGHGGMMDRFDSISFAAPVLFHVTRYFFTEPFTGKTGAGASTGRPE